MKSAPFSYHRPESVAEAASILAAHEDARVLAGGQSLVPMMNLRIAQPEALVDINHIAGLDTLDIEGGELVIGATTRQATLLASEAVAEALPLLRDAVSHVGYPATRHRGTVAGSAAHADPAAELPAALLALEARFTLRGKTEREVAATDFFVDYFTTAIERGEILAAVRVPIPSAGSRHAFVELARRYHDFPICAVAVQCQLEGRTIRAPHIALAGVGPHAVRAAGAEALLEGETPGDELFRAAADRVAEEISPLGDVHGSESYRRKVARALVMRALGQAVAFA